jgi:protein SCO1/2
MGKDFFLYTITLDPENDTPERLAQYAEKLGAGPGWKFLSGTPRTIQLLRTKLGFYFPDDPARDLDTSQHMGFLLMGNEPHGWWGTVATSATPRQIVQLINWLEPGAKGLR